MGIQLEREQWQPYFDRISKHLQGQQAEVEITGVSSADTEKRGWNELSGLIYDPRDDVFEIIVGDWDHFIQHPRKIRIEEVGQDLRSVEIEDADGNRQIVRLKQLSQ